MAMLRRIHKQAIKHRFRQGTLLLCLLLAGCGSPYFKMFSDVEQCVSYARRTSGIEIYGDAHTWWHNAAKYGYTRGKTPVEGAVLVLSKTSRLKWGHLAVVEEVKAPRVITVSHSNWGYDWYTRRVEYDDMEVRDVSPNNDWSQLRFFDPESGKFGRMYPASGFVYPYK